MSSINRLKEAAGWPVDVVTKVTAFDVFEHRGEVHSSDTKAYFFRDEEALQSWIGNYQKRAVGEDGPITVNIVISDWYGGKRFLESHQFENKEYWEAFQVKAKKKAEENSLLRKQLSEKGQE